MKIILTGSLGHISKPLAQELLNKGHQITVISSKEDRKTQIEAMGATAAIGSLTDAAFLAQTFAGADAVYAMTPPNLAVPDVRAYYGQVANAYAEAIRQSGIRRVVYLSSVGAEHATGTGLILGSHDSEGILGSLGDVSITFLRPGYFYYNLYNFTGMMKSMGMIGSNYGGDDRMVLVDTRDIAAAAAEELQASAGPRVRFVASAEHTANEVAAVVGSAIGKPEMTWALFTDEEVAGAMTQQGMPAHVVRDFVDLGAATHTGLLYLEYDKQPPAMGKVALAEFAQEFAAAYQA